MRKPFRFHIRKALANSNLQAALDGNAERRLKSRQEAYASLPEELGVMRQRANALRARTIANLDYYLDQFVANAQANGFIIHRAADAAQAIQIVRQIAQRIGAKVIAKSKSMVSEEILFNQALEAEGLQVVETDLGEYIVQLRGEPPSHILTPAVHLSRAEVGQTFEARLGIPYTDDIPSLTLAARNALRQVFLSADIGVSGVNFGVAENGILCLLTNEGNGRMVTTLPDIHIALMGIERLVPTLDDLALMLALLPRSATGQKLTVYTSLIRAPRSESEIDGPRERHIILVNNGRQDLRDSPLAESLYCIRCGACLNACPVFREIGGHAYVGKNGQGTPYSGPIGSVISPGLFGLAEFGNLARATSLCGACKEACPVDIDLPGLLLRVRAGETQLSTTQKQGSLRPETAHIPVALRAGLRMFTWIAASPGLYTATQHLAGAFSRLFSPRSAWLRLPAFTGWGQSRDFPRPALRPFRSLHAVSKDHEPFRPTSTPPAPPSQDALASPTQASAMSLVARFESELIALGGDFTCCSENEAGVRVVELLKSRQIDRIQSWDEDHLPVGLLDTLRNMGVQIIHEPDPSTRAGLTGAWAGIAETGTLVISTGEGRPTTASLLPEIHIAILHARDIYPGMTSLLESWKAGNRFNLQGASSVVLVSGPSRTADIEMTLTIGVHGPCQVHVFCLE